MSRRPPRPDCAWCGRALGTHTGFEVEVADAGVCVGWHKDPPGGACLDADPLAEVLGGRDFPQARVEEAIRAIRERPGPGLRVTRNLRRNT